MGIRNKCDCQAIGRFTNTSAGCEVFYFSICPDCNLEGSFLSFTDIFPNISNFSFEAQTINLPTCENGEFTVSGTGLTVGSGALGDVTGATSFSLVINSTISTLRLFFSTGIQFAASFPVFPVFSCSGGTTIQANNQQKELTRWLTNSSTGEERKYTISMG